MTFSRRSFIKSSLAVTAGFAGLHQLLGSQAFAAAKNLSDMQAHGFGPLVADPNGIFDLPAGFSYKVVSRPGDVMSDGLLLPGVPDGMAAFAGEGDNVLVVRNHEISPGDLDSSPWGEESELLSKTPAESIYDTGAAGKPPCLGGTSTFVWNVKEQRLVSQHLSLAGTVRNCAGGPTPWGSWLTCEETNLRAGDTASKDHGWVFEVPAAATGMAAPIPIKPMGRFSHEAVAVHPESGAVYQTEDTLDGLIYRYVPNVPGKLLEGGKLQALVVRGKPSLDTRNWFAPGTDTSAAIAPGTVFDVEWLTLDNVEAPEDDLRARGFAAGAARFARGEGMWYGNDAVYFACTNGGVTKKGQIWKYTPSPAETTDGEAAAPGKLELFLESPHSDILEACDNLCVSPWGDVIVCEDGRGVEYLHGVTKAGKVYRFGANRLSESELAGVCFSPDGSTLFVNIQAEGLTLAITGPWDNIHAEG
ncbi:DUF839 domain-containing protein [bacterium]|nr:DUF839 domain-containing protein [bacterium]